MKDAFTGLGTFGGAYWIRHELGNLSLFSWWQWILIACYMFCVVYACGFIAVILRDAGKKLYTKWILKRKHLRLHL
jgi:hypothetical protein